MDPGVRISVTLLHLGDTRATLTTSCAAGDLDACYRLGLSWHVGLEGWRNVKKARALYESACDHGHGEACLAVEHADWMGWGSSEDPINVVGERVVSCEREVDGACLLLAELLGEADVRPGVAAARGMAPLGPVTSAGEVLGRACERGHQQACDQVRLLALRHDPVNVRRHSGVLCAFESTSACEAYADACAAGVGGPVDLAEAQRLYAQRCRPPSSPAPARPIVPPPPPLSPNALPSEVVAHRRQEWRAAESLRRQPTPETEDDRRRAEDTARSCDKAAALTSDPAMAAELRRRACQHRTHKECGGG